MASKGKMKKMAEKTVHKKFGPIDYYRGGSNDHKHVTIGSKKHWVSIDNTGIMTSPIGGKNRFLLRKKDK